LAVKTFEPVPVDKAVDEAVEEAVEEVIEVVVVKAVDVGSTGGWRESQTE
jgi:hypothetical protein